MTETEVIYIWRIIGRYCVKMAGALIPMIPEESIAAPYSISKRCKISIFQAGHFGLNQQYQVCLLLFIYYFIIWTLILKNRVGTIFLMIKYVFQAWFWDLLLWMTHFMLCNESTTTNWRIHGFYKSCLIVDLFLSKFFLRCH